MLSRVERRLLDGMEESLRTEDPRFAGEFDQVTRRLRQHRRVQARVGMLLALGVLALSAGVAIVIASFDAAIGLPIAALGCALLALAIMAAQDLPTVVAPNR